MNKEIQDKAWAVMPQELKDELRVNKIIKTSYHSTTSMEKKITMDDFCKSVGKTEEGIKSGNLDLSGTGITSLPENLTVGGSLYIKGCTGITSLPDNLTVGGYLDLYGCAGITSLPDNLTVGDYLDLRGTGITSLPENLTVGGSLYIKGCTGITSLPDNLTVGGWLDLEGCTGITSLPDNLTVGGNLDLRGTGITSLPDNLTVGGNLDLRGTGITSLPENLTVGGSLYIKGCTGITSLPDNLTVGGNLDLSGTGITSLPENLTVGGSLNLRGTGITSLPDNLTVGGYLDLRGTGITSLPENLTVGGSLNLRGTGITSTSKVKRTLSAETRRKINHLRNIPIVWEWSNRKYIKVDGVFSVVDNHHGNVWKVHQIGNNKQMYIVTDGNNHYAHGETIDEARKDLLYKIADRDKSEYEHLTLSSELTYNEAIECYRVITGACSAGTRQFCESVLSVKKEKYTIAEIIELTHGQFGNSIFAGFFNNK